MSTAAGGNLQSIFQNSPPSSIYNSLYNSKMSHLPTSQAFVDSPSAALTTILTSDLNIAHYEHLETFAGVPEYTNCQVITPWISKYPLYVSMALPRNHTLREKMKKMMMTYHQSGVLRMLQDRYKMPEQTCTTWSKGLGGIGFKKTLVLFCLLASGIFMGSFIALLERIYPKWRKK